MAWVSFSTMNKEQMNVLQSYGLISDECVTWDDVPQCDRERVNLFLEAFKSDMDSCNEGNEEKRQATVDEAF